PTPTLTTARLANAKIRFVSDDQASLKLNNKHDGLIKLDFTRLLSAVTTKINEIGTVVDFRFKVKVVGLEAEAVLVGGGFNVVTTIGMVSMVLKKGGKDEDRL
ncbi:Hypothetical predicted protein, partial [Olea europaea subsp. europaea]